MKHTWEDIQGLAQSDPVARQTIYLESYIGKEQALIEAVIAYSAAIKAMQAQMIDLYTRTAIPSFEACLDPDLQAERTKLREIMEAMTFNGDAD